MAQVRVELGDSKDVLKSEESQGHRSALAEVFLGINEAAGMLKISPATLYGWIHQRKIPYRKHGRRVIFHRHDLENWSEGQRVEPLGRLQPWVDVQGGSHGRPRSAPCSLKIRRTAGRSNSQT